MKIKKAARQFLVHVGVKLVPADLAQLGKMVTRLEASHLPGAATAALFGRAVMLGRQMHSVEKELLAIWEGSVLEILALRATAADILLTRAERDNALMQAARLRRKTLLAHEKLEEEYHRLAGEMRRNAASRWFPSHDFSPIFTTASLENLIRA